MTDIAFRLLGASLSPGGRPNGRDVLHRIDLAVPTGRFVGLLGPNGAGKTTLMRALLGLLPAREGRILVLDRPVHRGNPAIGYLPQTRSAAPVRLSGRGFVASALAGHRWGVPWFGRAAQREVDRVLALVDAESLADRSLDRLSGGERQRLLLAQALLGSPRLLLLDEPLISLDPSRADAVVSLVRRVQLALGITVLFSAHELNPLLPALDQVLYLGNGEARLGSIDEVITGPVLSRLYGAPIEVVRLAGRIFVMSAGHDLGHATDCHHGATQRVSGRGAAGRGAAGA
ncbi:metal ABC transporter ATP-binding protein [Lichenicoccus sp.]|uniref:metal ABC transporter ATP-binding protein n=1 Tax=Lichenicoccus sp. TaxID=2781899 RepID=UPI003D0DEDD9